MGYNIPYDSDYQDWYGVPQNVTRLSAVLEQTENEDGVPIGRITASWSIPDNGGTFNILSSTDDANYTIEKLNVNGNVAIIDVEPNTEYYIKVVTVLGGNQSTGTTLQVPVGTIPTPSAPILTALATGIKIDVGVIPAGYSVLLEISDGTNTEIINSTEQVTMYACENNGTYTVTSAFVDANGNVGEYTESVSVSFEEVYVRKTSHWYIKSAEVNGSSLMLTTGDNQTIIFQGGGGGGLEPIVQDDDTIILPTGHMDGIIEQQMLSFNTHSSRIITLN